MHRSALYVVLAIVGVALAVLPLAVLPYIRFAGGVRELSFSHAQSEASRSIWSKIERVGDNAYEIRQPMTWFEVTVGAADWVGRYHLPEITILAHITWMRVRELVGELYPLIVGFKIDCESLRQYLLNTYVRTDSAFFDHKDLEIVERFFFSNNCTMLYRMFDDEESWYATLSVAGLLRERTRATAPNRDHYIVMLVHVVAGDAGVERIRVLFFDLLDEEDMNAALRYVEGVAKGNRRLLYIPNSLTPSWNRLFDEITSAGGDVLMFDVVSFMHGETYFDPDLFVKRVLVRLVGGDAPISKICDFIAFSGALYIEDGRLRIYDAKCRLMQPPEGVECYAVWE